MEKNERYKMHKVKKRWVTLSVASATMLMSAIGAQSVSADTDTVDDASTNQAVVDSAVTQASADSQTTAVAETATSEPTATQDEAVVVSENQAETAPATDTTALETVKWVPTESADTSVSPAALTESKVATNQSTTSNATVPEALTSLSNVKEVDGKYYYYNNDGSVKKNFAVSVGDTILYFGADGAYTDTSKVAVDTSSTQVSKEDATFTANNRAYSTSAENFEAIDGYLTADSWYRPKSILKDGKTWAASTKDDFRPLLMAWWPDTETKRQYVNYMNNVLGIDKTYSESASQADLAQAARLVQARAEQRITAEKNTKWLRDAISAFVKTQPQWNGESEKPYDDHLQNGALRFDNVASLTPDTQSDYRLLNRAPSSQTGTLSPKYTYNPSDPLGGYEYLLANDVDNSNPVVQAESLNWLHYLLNFGSIYANDADGNFDSIRVDAVDNVDADLLQISSDYLKAAYKIDQNNKNANDHVSIVEAWSDNDTPYLHDDGDNLMNMDNKLRLSLLWSLAKPLDKRSGLNPLIHNSVVDREVDDREVEELPNYAFARAHDSEVQDLIRDIIKAEINPDSFGYSFTQDEIDKAFKIYNEDLKKTDKKYTHYNVPLSYTLLLTNKGSIPRIYYGDMFTDDGQYMANKTMNYDAIETLLKARIKYVAGGQAMQNYNIGNGEILTSVRYGKGALKQSDKGDSLTRTSGVGIVMGNQPSFSLEGNVVALNMGAGHANQEYRALMVSTDTGVATYQTDAEAISAGLTKRTDEKGYLYFLNDDLKGVANPQVSGFLQVWVPVGAADNQDIRTEASTTASTDGKSLHQDAAMDSRVMFEGFSNFQSFATKEDEYTDVVIAKNVDKFVSWGITDFEMAPQYVSSTDGQFLDSVIQNGYAFTDRYDLGLSKANKYGTADQLVAAIKALHSKGIKVMADWVPDQMYTFPKQEVVTVTRADKFGTPTEGSTIKGTLYVTDTKSSGDDYQAKYGGEFLEELQAKYPELFTKKQISTGQVMDPSVKIKQWSAKYFNGSNILGRGADYVLSDQVTHHYFNLDNDKLFLPNALLGKTTASGISYDGKGYVYNSSATGAKVVSTFVTEGNNLYYFDKDGYMVYGQQTIDGSNYYFLDNGVALRNAVYTDAKGKSHYYGNDGKRYENGYHQFGNDSWRHFKNGVMTVGLAMVDGNIQYFDKDGLQVKDKIVITSDGKVRYFDKNSGNAVVNTFISDKSGNWYYLGQNGAAVTGAQTIKGQHLYFEANAKQVKGDFATDKAGHLRYYDADSGEMWTNRFVADKAGNWYYLGQDGVAVTGAQTIGGKQYYFQANGHQVKGDYVTDENGKRHYYDAQTGQLVEPHFTSDASGNWYYIGEDGESVKGWQTIDGKKYFFDYQSGVQVKHQIKTVGDASTFFFDENGAVKTNTWGRDKYGVWRYFGSDGNALQGIHTIDGKTYAFGYPTSRYSSAQVKGAFYGYGAGARYFDANSGEMWTNRFVNVDGNWYYLGADGYVKTGAQTIDGKHYFFDEAGRQIKGDFITDNNGKRHYYDAASGEMWTNRFVQGKDGSWYYLGQNGVPVTGAKTINGQRLYFDANGKQVKGDVVRDNRGRYRYYDADSGEQVFNRWVQASDGTWYYIGSNGFATMRG